MPVSDKPARLMEKSGKRPSEASPEKTEPKATEPAKPIVSQTGDLRSRVWTFVQRAPSSAERR